MTGTMVRFVVACNGKQLGDQHGTRLEYVPRKGEFVDFVDGYEKSLDVYGEVINVTWQRSNINNEPEALVSIAARRRP